MGPGLRRGDVSPPPFARSSSVAIADSLALPHDPTMKRRQDRTLRDKMAELGSLLRENISVVILIFGLAAAFFAAQTWMTGQYSGARTEEAGEVIRFGNYENDTGGGPIVFVRTANGQIQGLVAHPASLADCRTGSRIRLVRRGSVMTVALRGCVPMLSPGRTSGSTPPS